MPLFHCHEFWQEVCRWYSTTSCPKPLTSIETKTFRYFLRIPWLTGTAITATIESSVRADHQVPTVNDVDFRAKFNGRCVLEQRIVSVWWQWDAAFDVSSQFSNRSFRLPLRNSKGFGVSVSAITEDRR